MLNPMIHVITVSDRVSEGKREDLSGPALKKAVSSDFPEGEIKMYIVRDEIDTIEAVLRTISSQQTLALIITTGGTGCAERDVTPEATRKVIDKEIPGVMEYLRSKNAENHPYSWLSRGVCGIKNRMVICNLPGSPEGAVSSYSLISGLLRHILELLSGEITDCAKK